MFLREIVSEARVGDLAIKSVPVLQASQTMGEAAVAMRTQSHGSALVYQGGTLVGIFTERDLLKQLAAGAALEQPVASAMTRSPRTVTTEDGLVKVILLMNEGGYRRLPVVNTAGLPVGIVDVKSVMHFLVEHMPKAVYNQAPQALLTSRNREGA